MRAGLVVEVKGRLRDRDDQRRRVPAPGLIARNKESEKRIPVRGVPHGVQEPPRLDEGAHRAASNGRMSSSLLISLPDMTRGDQRFMKIGDMS